MYSAILRCGTLWLQNTLKTSLKRVVYRVSKLRYTKQHILFNNISVKFDSNNIYFQRCLKCEPETRVIYKNEKFHDDRSNITWDNVSPMYKTTEKLNHENISRLLQIFRVRLYFYVSNKYAICMWVTNCQKKLHINIL